jgi:hypothetical protein
MQQHDGGTDPTSENLQVDAVDGQAFGAHQTSTRRLPSAPIGGFSGAILKPVMAVTSYLQEREVTTIPVSA